MKVTHFGSNNGATLIELMVSLFIIAIIILGMGMFFFYSRVAIVREGYPQAALLIASGRLEELKAAEYSKIIPSDFNPYYNPYYITRGDNWNLSISPTYDSVTVDNLTNQKMLTQAQYHDDDGMSNSYDYLEVKVTVEYGNRTNDTVSLTTLIAPH